MIEIPRNKTNVNSNFLGAKSRNTHLFNFDSSLFETLPAHVEIAHQSNCFFKFSVDRIAELLHLPLHFQLGLQFQSFSLWHSSHFLDWWELQQSEDIHDLHSKYQSSESSNYPQKHHKWNPLGFDGEQVASRADWQSSENSNSCWRTARLMEILLKATSHFWRCTECLGLLEFWCVLWWSHPIQQLLADVSLFRVWFEFCGFSDRVFSAICSIYFLCYQFILKEGIC